MLADYPVIPLYFHSVVANPLNHIRSQALATNTGTFMRSRTNTKRAAAASVEQFGIARGTDARDRAGDAERFACRAVKTEGRALRLKAPESQSGPVAADPRRSSEPRQSWGNQDCAGQ
jgi:hypothetical protein